MVSRTTDSGHGFRIDPRLARGSHAAVATEEGDSWIGGAFFLQRDTKFFGGIGKDNII
jgi:hypothetical protein